MRKILMVVCVLAVLAGCQSGNLTTLTDAQLTARTTTANQARMSPEGHIEANYQGIGPTIAEVEPNAYWLAEQGPGAVINFPLPSGVAMMYSPKDVKIGKLSYTPKPTSGQSELVIEGLEANISAPMAQDVAGLREAYPNLVIMNKDAVLADVEKARIAGQITSDVAKAVIDFLGKWLLPVPAVPVAPVP